MEVDLMYLGFYLALYAIPIVVYLVYMQKDKQRPYNIPTWYNFLKRLYARPTIQTYLSSNRESFTKLKAQYQEMPRPLLTDEDSDTLEFLSTDTDSNSLYLSMSARRDKTARISFRMLLADGTTFVLPNKDNFLLVSRAKHNWRAAGFGVEIVQPFHKCRIYFDGFLRRITPSDDVINEHVKFNFIWNCASKPLFYPSDFNAQLYSDATCREPWQDGNWINMLGDMTGYEQYGGLIGELTYSNGAQRCELRMPALKRRLLGIDRTMSWARDVSIFAAAENGYLFHFGVRSLKYGCTHLKFGSVRRSNGDICSISDNDIYLGHMGDAGTVPNSFTIHVESNTFKIIQDTKHIVPSSSNEQYGFVSKIISTECCINATIGAAMGTFWYSQKGDGLPLPQPLLRPLKNDDDVSNFVLNLRDRNCQILDLTGGKACSLAQLMSLELPNVLVPNGFVVTTEAFNYQLSSSKELLAAIKIVEETSKFNRSDKLRDACKKVASLFEVTGISDNIKAIVFQEFHRNHDEGIKYAVRSSGTIEDGEDLSCAGQNKTFLGCADSDSVLKAITNCWSSLFEFNSVVYRRQNGFPVRTDIAVVVQQLVPADVAGVLFTCHPTNGDPSQMVITSNYGLGESVVSGTVDPDVITINRSYDGTLKIDAKTLGTKKVQVSSLLSEEVDVEVGKQCEYSITDIQALELGNIGAILEKSFGSARDIEWCYHNNQLYLLQSRAVTTATMWTDFELLHEFDTPCLSKDEIYTTANVGEVLSGASSALSISTIVRLLEDAMNFLTTGTIDVYNDHILPNFNRHVHMNVLNTMLRDCNDHIDLMNRINQLAVLGHEVFQVRHLHAANCRHGAPSKRKQLAVLAQMARYAWRSSKTVAKAVQYGQSFSLSLDKCSSAKDLYLELDSKLKESMTLGLWHGEASRVSILYQILAMTTLMQDSEDITAELCEDIATLLTANADVISAEVPKKMQEIAAEIGKSGKGDEFCALEPSKGLQWIRGSCAEAAVVLDGFLQDHGHRSFREFELAQSTWLDKPEVLVEMIQMNVRHKVQFKKYDFLSIDDTLSKLKTPLKSKMTRTVLRWMIKKCRQTVGRRETTKCELVRVVGVFRRGFFALGSLMRKEGKLPEKELVFHFTMHELGTLLEGPNPALLSKALKRRRLLSQWNSVRYPEISECVPQPIIDNSSAETERQTEGDVSLKGTPACNGTVTARACVITSLDDVGLLQNGDVLVTHSTDIAWSPYFPILGGVVTELGGLISHGAVVAREYGLPCLVGVQGATSSFRTGDRVTLSTDNGIIALAR